MLEPSALGESATETVLHALPKPVVGLDVLPGYVDFGKTKNIGGVAVDDLTKMAIFGLIIVVGKASALDAEDAEIVFCCCDSCRRGGRRCEVGEMGWLGWGVGKGAQWWT